MKRDRKSPRTGGNALRIVGGLLLAAVSLAGAVSRASADEPPPSDQQSGNVVATGEANPNLASFDRMMIAFVESHHAPGAALAVTKNGRLVYARGFGYADVDAKEPVQPNSLFRLASLSKPFTAVAILKLAEQGKLKLDERVLDILHFAPHLEPGAREDPRWREITVRELLQHRGGFDRDKSIEPMFRSVQIAEALEVRPPAGPKEIIRYMLGRPLDFDPGRRYAYSNFGYCLLGRVVEAASGQPYARYVRREVLAPLGIRDMRVGRTLPGKRARREVHYYAHNRETGRAVVGPDIGERVPLPYGAWYLEAMDAHGGWIASAADLVRFAAAFDDPEHCPILSRESIETMFARPPGLAGHNRQGRPKGTYYGCGWDVHPERDAKGPMTWHNGLLDGSSTLLVRRGDGVNWAVLFNGDSDQRGKQYAAEIDPLVHKAADAVKEWPAGEP